MTVDMKCLCRAILFFLLYLGLLLVIVVLRDIVFSFFGVAYEKVFYKQTPVLLGVQFNYFGFVVPLIISLLLIPILFRPRQSLANASSMSVSRPELILAISLLSSFIISAFIYTLQKITSSSAGLNSLAFVSVLAYLAYRVYRGTMQRLLPVAFILGFAEGIISDAGSITRVTAPWGGGGVFDGDFVIPISLFISILLIEKLSLKPSKRFR